MALKIFSKLSLPRNKIARFLVLEVATLLTSAFIMLALAIAFTFIFLHYFTEPYTPLLPGEEDIGKAMEGAAVFILACFASLFFSIPLVVMNHIYILKKFFLRRK
jgi:cellulose synthase/poly-beta-1,6-N-acetylglucosamine synthase-like glycosyltransferase